MGWLDATDRTLGRLIAGGSWLVVPEAVILFLQWPLRDFVQWGSREANDLGQWVFALYVSMAMTFATRERAHLAVDAIAHDYPARVRAAIARWGSVICVVPWTVFMIWTVEPTVQRSVMALEKFPDTSNFAYFLFKFPPLLLPALPL